MLEPLLWIILIYLASGLAVHAVHWRNVRKHRQYGNGLAGADAARACRNIALVVRNQQHQLEWVIRSLMFSHWLKGQSLRLTVIDCGSDDHTLRMVRRLAERMSFSWYGTKTEYEVYRILELLEDGCLETLFLDGSGLEQRLIYP